MKLLSIQGHFGNLDGQKIEFTEGLCSRVLPNGWGKTTLCAFIRVMLYGLNTAKRDTSAALSDKTRYYPLDGKPMSGRMTVEFGGRPVTIVRETTRAGLMQGFQAYYEDTGELCDRLSARNCGQVLFGMGEDAFLSSAMVDGTDMTRPSAELSELILSMAQSGDTGARCGVALKQLNRWKLNINSGNGHGEQPDLEREQQDLEQRLGEMRALATEIQKQRQAVVRLHGESESARKRYEASYLAYAGHMAEEEGRLQVLQQESERKIRELSEDIPDESLLREAEEALYGYEGAVRLEREKRQNMPLVETNYEQKLKELERRQKVDEVERNRVTRPRIRWGALVIALLLAIAAAATALLDIDWGPYTKYVQYGLSGLAAFSVLLSFIGSVPKLKETGDTYNAERERLALEHKRIVDEQQMAATVLQEAHDHAMQAVQRIWPDIRTIEKAAEWVRGSLNDWQALRREQSRLQDILVEMKRHRPSGDGDDDLKTSSSAARTEMNRAQKQEEAARQTLSQMEGRLQAAGDYSALAARLGQVKQLLEQSEIRYRAVAMAAKTVERENAALSARVSPEITKLATQYLAFLTDENYKEVKLDASLRARCATNDGSLLDALRLSSGTRDQLYFALRLAVCQVLSGRELVPLILDDPFLTWDDNRTERGMHLLRELSLERQIILLTCRESAEKGEKQEKPAV